jgi:hypothetical protein
MASLSDGRGIIKEYSIPKGCNRKNYYLIKMGKPRNK